VASSITEAEYMALFEGIREALWLKSLINEIKLKLNGPINIFEDNQGCISIANNPTRHKRTKHIDIKYHFTREQIKNKLFCVKYISTDFQRKRRKIFQQRSRRKLRISASFCCTIVFVGSLQRCADFSADVNSGTAF